MTPRDPLEQLLLYGAETPADVIDDAVAQLLELRAQGRLEPPPPRPTDPHLVRLMLIAELASTRCAGMSRDAAAKRIELMAHRYAEYQSPADRKTGLPSSENRILFGLHHLADCRPNVRWPLKQRQLNTLLLQCENLTRRRIFVE
jgi:hypothetical protein